MEWFQITGFIRQILLSIVYQFEIKHIRYFPDDGKNWSYYDIP